MEREEVKGYNEIEGEKKKGCENVEEGEREKQHKEREREIERGRLRKEKKEDMDIVHGK
jgi:hypothetical protein